MGEAKPTLCIVNFNGVRHLPTTLGAAVALADQFAEILLVDNASTDDSVALVARDFPQVQVLRMPGNAGPGAARNAGLREARGDLVLLIDNDVCLSPDCAERLTAALTEHPAAAIAAPRVLYAHNPEIIQYDGAASHFLGVMMLENPDVPVVGSCREVRRTSSVITCAIMVDRRRLPDPAPFDESFFIYLEDHDFAVRMRALGAEILAVPEAVCYHGDGTAGLSIRALGKYSSMRVFCMIRNRWLVMLKSYSGRSLLVLSPLLVVYELAQLGLVLRKGWWREWCRAVGWVAGNWGDIMSKRRDIQRRRKRPDRELLSGGRIPFRVELTSGNLERRLLRALDATAAAYWSGAARLI